ncbi:hypothetical protein HDU93_008538 [Gonapodya sp. JEL0774]|nr:hypothetical protein HDU93_008538 [Gonapodya sp. JEL0774]
MSNSYFGGDQSYSRRERPSLDIQTQNRARNSSPAGAHKPSYNNPPGISRLLPTPPPSSSALPGDTFSTPSLPSGRGRTRQPPTPSPESSDEMDGQFEPYSSLPSASTIAAHRRSQVLNLQTGDEIQRVLREQQEHLFYLQQQLHVRTQPSGNPNAGAAPAAGPSQRSERPERAERAERGERAGRNSIEARYSGASNDGAYETGSLGGPSLARNGSGSTYEPRPSRTSSPARNSYISTSSPARNVPLPRTSSPARTSVSTVKPLSAPEIATVERTPSTSSSLGSSPPTNALNGNAPRRTPSLLAATAASARAKDKWLALDGVKPSQMASSPPERGDSGSWRPRPLMTRSTTAPSIGTISNNTTTTRQPSLNGAPTSVQKSSSTSLPRTGHTRTPSVSLSREAIPVSDASANTSADSRPPSGRPGGPSKVKALVAAFATLDQQAKDIPIGYAPKPFDPVPGASGFQGDDHEDNAITGVKAAETPQQQPQRDSYNGASSIPFAFINNEPEEASWGGSKPAFSGPPVRPAPSAQMLPVVKPAPSASTPVPVRPAGTRDSGGRPLSVAGRVVGGDYGVSNEEDPKRRASLEGRAVSASPVPVQSVVLSSSPSQVSNTRSPPQHQKVQQLTNQSHERPSSPDRNPPPNQSPSPPGIQTSAPIPATRQSSASSFRSSKGSMEDDLEDMPLDALRGDRVSTLRTGPRNPAPRPMSVLKPSDGIRRGPSKSVSFSSEGVRVREVPHREDEAYQYASDNESDEDEEDYSDDESMTGSEEEDDEDFTDEEVRLCNDGNFLLRTDNSRPILHNQEESEDDYEEEEIDPDEDLEETEEEDEPPAVDTQRQSQSEKPQTLYIPPGPLMPVVSPNRPVTAVTYSTTRLGKDANTDNLGRKSSKDDGQPKNSTRSSMDGSNVVSTAIPEVDLYQPGNRTSIAAAPSGWGGVGNGIQGASKSRPVSWANPSFANTPTNAYVGATRSTSVKAVGSSRVDESNDLSNFLPSRRAQSEKGPRDTASSQIGVIGVVPASSSSRSRPTSMMLVEQPNPGYPTPPVTPPTSTNGLKERVAANLSSEDTTEDDESDWDSEDSEDESGSGSEEESDYGSDDTETGTESELGTPDKPLPPPRSRGNKPAFVTETQYADQDDYGQQRRGSKSNGSSGAYSAPPLSPLSSDGSRKIGSLRRIPNSSVARKISFHRNTSIRKSIRDHHRPISDTRSDKGSMKSFEGSARREGSKRGGSIRLGPNRMGSVRVGSIRRPVQSNRFTPHVGFEPQYGKKIDPNQNSDRDSGRRSARSGAKPKKPTFWKSLKGIFALGGPKKIVILPFGTIPVGTTVVILKAKKEEASKVADILAEGARLTRQNDAGCIDYTVVQDKA